VAARLPARPSGTREGLRQSTARETRQATNSLTRNESLLRAAHLAPQQGAGDTVAEAR